MSFTHTGCCVRDYNPERLLTQATSTYLLSGWAVDWTLGVTDWTDLLADGRPKKFYSVTCRKEQVQGPGTQGT